MLKCFSLRKFVKNAVCFLALLFGTFSIKTMQTQNLVLASSFNLQTNTVVAPQLEKLNSLFGFDISKIFDSEILRFFRDTIIANHPELLNVEQLDKTQFEKILRDVFSRIVISKSLPEDVNEYFANFDNFLVFNIAKLAENDGREALLFDLFLMPNLEQHQIVKQRLQESGSASEWNVHVMDSVSQKELGSGAAWQLQTIGDDAFLLEIFENSFKQFYGIENFEVLKNSDEYKNFIENLKNAIYVNFPLLLNSGCVKESSNLKLDLYCGENYVTSFDLGSIKPFMSFPNEVVDLIVKSFSAFIN